MNILILSPFFPYPLDQGGKIRVYNLIKHLSCEHNITLACLCQEDSPDTGALSDYCEEIVVAPGKGNFPVDFARFLFAGEAFNSARFASSSFEAKLRQLLANRSFDLVQIEFSLLWRYASLFPSSIPIALDAHNIEHKNVQQIGASKQSYLWRMMYRLEEKRLRKAEERAFSESAVCVAVSDREREEIARHAGLKAKVITAANGVDPERFIFKPGRTGTGKILFLGGMDYLPNLDAASYFLTQIFPLVRKEHPEATVLLVGRELEKLGELTKLPGVVPHESVPEVLPWFYEADVLAVPLRQGAGTRIKVLEAMSAGLPVVTTEKGCEGIEVANGRELMIADGPIPFAKAVLQILDRPVLGEFLAQNARRLILAAYTWKSAAGIMGKSYETLLERRSSSGTGEATISGAVT